VLHLRPPVALAEADAAAPSLTRLARPRGYFSWPRDVVLLDGREVAERREGIASIALANLRLPVERVGSSIAGVFNEERILGRVVPRSENRVAILEMTW
jgi:hypothetical protein